MLPNDFGPHQTVYGWYVKLCDEKIIESFFIELKKIFYLENNRKVKKLCTDGSLAQHLRKNELTSINPRNKNKNTINRFITTDENGIPLNLIIANGTAHDSIFFNTSIYLAKEDIEMEKGWSCHADKGFDDKKIRKFIRTLGGNPEIPFRQLGRNKGIKNKKDAFRFVVERTIAWMNSFKNLKTIFIKKSNRIKQMSLLFANIVYLRRFSESDLANFVSGSTI